jgi:hypothetical protein
MKEIYIIFSILSSIMPLTNSYHIPNTVKKNSVKLVSSRSARLLSAVSKSAGNIFDKTSTTGAASVRSGLRRSLSDSFIHTRLYTDASKLRFLNDICRKGNAAMAIKFIQAYSVTPNINSLNIAAKSGNLELVKYLIEKNGVEPEIRTLVLATYSKNLDLLKYLVDDALLIPEQRVLNAALASGSEENYKFLKSVQTSNAFHESFMNQLQNYFQDIVESYGDDIRTKWNAHLLKNAIDENDYDNSQKLVQDNGVQLDNSILQKAASLEDGRIFKLLVESV